MKKKILILLLVICAFVVFIFLNNNDQTQKINNNSDMGEWSQVFAAGPCDASSHNITGWAYAYPIGPISLSCTNQGAPVNYGVNIIKSFSPEVVCSGGITCDSTYTPVYTGSTNYHHVRITGNSSGAGSGTFTVPDGLSMLDVTVVGGGAAGFKWGGAGGNVKTETNYKVVQGESINVVVGAGGVFEPNPSISSLRVGKGSSFGSVSVNNTVEQNSGSCIRSNGGSGGGGYTQNAATAGRQGGSNGSDGLFRTCPGGVGQHLTTVGIDGKTYAAGGGGGGSHATSAIGGFDSFNSYNLGRASTGSSSSGGTPTSGSGSGGGAGFYNTSTGQWSNGGNGAAGVVIVRFPKLNEKELSGYAWSPTIGPISFNKNEICASGFCTEAEFPASNTNTKHVAKIEYVKSGVAKITGWARAISACNFNGKKCTTNGAGSDAGGWDGWIKFDGSTITSSTAEPYFVKEGTKYNTVIKTVSGEHLILGNAWGGDVLDARTPPSAVIGEIRYIDAKTTYNPDWACVSAPPAANFSLSCAKVSGTICYFNPGSLVTLKNLSTDPDEGSPCYVANDIKTSTWTPGATVSGKGNSSFTPTNTAEYTQNISLTVEDYQGNTNTKSQNWTLRRAIQTNFSCCIKGENGGGDCSSAANFKNCGESGFKSLTITEETKLFVRDSTDVAVHTVVASNCSISSPNWVYDKGDVSNPGANTASISIMKGGKIKRTACDSSGLCDDEEKSLDTMFGQIIKNPDFKEIPFD
ncbi:MAG TPA: hypothetical protein PKU93_00100 [Candidatus Pacearchaeota archaeon]|nr:hypothetical protein [Candidatus Pacearchaeota archaeon]